MWFRLNLEKIIKELGIFYTRGVLLMYMYYVHENTNTTEISSGKTTNKGLITWAEISTRQGHEYPAQPALSATKLTTRS
jgi:hypothetical protein